MGHPAQGRGICVDNARGFRIFEILQNFAKFCKMGVF